MVEPTREQLAHGYTAALAHIDRLRRERDALKALNAELLAALKACVEWIDPEDPKLVNYADARRAEALARAVIAKAEGR